MMKRNPSSLSELKDKAADKRLQRAYGITLAEYNKMLDEQGGVCAICGKPPTNKRLHTDHDHLSHKVVITITKDSINGTYTAWAEGGAHGVNIYFYPDNKTRKEARARAKLDAKRKSVRGLLCWPCNRALQKFRDNPDLMESAAKYIRKYKASINAK